ncbi:MAG: FAD-dependent oxidoreductase [Actinomycetota bacterium]
MVDSDIAVIGAGVVGSAAALALARRGVAVTLLEAERAPGLAASGTNSGILHTGFDSPPGELETELILRSAELRDPDLETLGVPVLRCGALLRPRDGAQRDAVAELAATAERNGVRARLGEDGSLEVPGESATDPIAYTSALAAAAQRHGADLRTGFRVASIRPEAKGLRIDDEGGGGLSCHVAVNCAGLYADEVARSAGDESFEIYPRKGEFFVFDPPGGQPPDRILLPVPSKRTKGVLVFPTIDGKVVAGPTAVNGTDKGDWSVRPEALDEVLPKAAQLLPALEGAEPIASYAGLRPAGRGVNYLIGPSGACPGLVNVAAIRSTGLTASLGIAEHVTGIVGELGVELGPEQPLEPAPAPAQDGPWWRRVAEHRGQA